LIHELSDASLTDVSGALATDEISFAMKLKKAVLSSTPPRTSASAP